MNTTVRLTERSGSTSSQRSKGFVPVVVYGAGSDSQSFTADAKTLNEILGKNPRAILKVELPDSGSKNVVIHKCSVSRFHASCCMWTCIRLI